MFKNMERSGEKRTDKMTEILLEIYEEYNDSKTITITAKSSGIATITIKGELYDSSAEEENEFEDVSEASNQDNSNDNNLNNNETPLFNIHNHQEDQ